MPELVTSDNHKHDNADRNFCTLFWNGGRKLIEGFDQNGDDIIIRNSQDKELDNGSDTEDFLARQSMLSHAGIYRKGVTSFDGHLKNSGITRAISEKIPDNTERYWDDARETTLWLGSLFVGIDAPNTDIPLPTVQQQRDLEMDIKWLTIHPNNVPFWRTNKDTWTLSQIMIQEVNHIEDPFGTSEEILTFIWWTADTWTRFIKDDNVSKSAKVAGLNLIKIESGTNEFGVVPFLRCESIFDTVSLCRMQREILFRHKVSITNTAKTGNTQYVATKLHSHKDVKIDMKKDLITILGDGEIDTIGVDAETMKQNREDLFMSIKNLKHAMHMPVGENINQSGISKREDKSVLYSTLVKFSKHFSDAENFLGKLGWGEEYNATYPKTSSDFVVESEDELHDMIEKAIDNSMPKQYIDELRKKLTNILDNKLAESIDFAKSPIITKERTEALTTAGDLIPIKVKAEYLGIDPVAAAKSVEEGMDRKIQQETAIITGGFSNNEPDQDEVDN